MLIYKVLKKILTIAELIHIFIWGSTLDFSEKSEVNKT